MLPTIPRWMAAFLWNPSTKFWELTSEEIRSCCTLLLGITRRDPAPLNHHAWSCCFGSPRLILLLCITLPDPTLDSFCFASGLICRQQTYTPLVYRNCAGAVTRKNSSRYQIPSKPDWGIQVNSNIGRLNQSQIVVVLRSKFRLMKWGFLFSIPGLQLAIIHHPSFEIQHPLNF